MKLTDEQKIEFTEMVDEFTAKVKKFFAGREDYEDYGLVFFAGRELTLGEKLLDDDSGDAKGTGFLLGDERVIASTIGSKMAENYDISRIILSSAKAALHYKQKK